MQIVIIQARGLQRSWGQIQLQSLVWCIDFVWSRDVKHAITIYLEFLKLEQLMLYIATFMLKFCDILLVGLILCIIGWSVVYLQFWKPPGISFMLPEFCQIYFWKIGWMRINMCVRCNCARLYKNIVAWKVCIMSIRTS